MSRAVLIFPHQLFADHPCMDRDGARMVMIEDSLFFGDAQYPAKFHKQKLWLHRASMMRHAARLRDDGHEVDYVEYETDRSQLDDILKGLKQDDVDLICLADPVDDILTRRLRHTAAEHDLEIEFHDTPGFINARRTNTGYLNEGGSWLMADFYRFQRRRLELLMDGDKPEAGKWSFDAENRKKVPASHLDELPALPDLERDEIDQDARLHVQERFSDNPGSLDQLFYPTSYRDAQTFLHDFLENRLDLFGDYEDAIEAGQSWLWHSVLTPALNVGLLTPRQIVRATLAANRSRNIPLNSLEGFLRQIVGWREFMRAAYEELGVSMRNANHWGHGRAMPACFYDGTTGIAPIDDTIGRVLATGYCHHIERLMVLGGFMFLCEIEPDDIYRWFMELFVDSYDWVMVPNVYAMSQHADGGAITTKPYFSGSAYIKRMSHYEDGPWADIWDGLYWRWVYKHREKLSDNPRWAMMVSQAERMDTERRNRHIETAETFLSQLDGKSSQ